MPVGKSAGRDFVLRSEEQGSRQAAVGAGRRVVVIGGGISGLAAACRVKELCPGCEVTLLEAAPRLGGVLETVHRNGFLIERSADNFITNSSWAVDLCRSAGLGDQLLPTSGSDRTAMVVHDGRLEKVPAGFMLMAPARIAPLLTTPILSPWGKLRLLTEYLVPRRGSDSDESLASFARRRLGRETFERIVQPLVGGIYAADPEKLSLQATLPRFIEMERRFGSLIRGGIHASRRAAGDQRSSGARYGLFVAPERGMSSLVDAVAAQLPADCVRTSSPVEAIAREPSGNCRLQVAGSRPVTIECDGLIVATPANRAARLLAAVDSELSRDLARIEYAGTAVVSLAFKRGAIAGRLDGFGFVVPEVEKRKIIAASFASLKFAGRAPDGEVLIRVFIGGALHPEWILLSDDELQKIAVEELRALLQVRGEPMLCDVARWPGSMPQYHLGHVDLVARVDRAVARWPNLALAGNAYRGVGIPQCVHSGQQAAEQIAAAIIAR